MKMDVIWAQSPKIGIGHAVTKFGDDSLLLSSKKLGEDTALLLGLTKTREEKRIQQLRLLTLSHRRLKGTRWTIRQLLH